MKTRRGLGGRGPEVRLERIDSDHRRRYVLARTYSAGHQPRRDAGQAPASPRKPEQAGIAAPLPRRVRTILFHRLSPGEKRLVNGMGEDARGRRQAME